MKAALRKEHDLYEDFLKLECKDGVWRLVRELHERRHGEEILKTFSSKEEAIRYFCFYKLSYHLFKTYLRKIIYDNNIGAADFTLGRLIEIFNELGISDNLYGIHTYKKDAINLIAVPKGKNFIVLTDERGALLRQSRELNLSEALFFMFELVYMTHLIKIHVAEMQKKGLLKDGLTEEDYRILLA